MYLVGNKEGEFPRKTVKIFAKSISKLVEETFDILRLGKKAINNKDFKDKKKPYIRRIRGYQKNHRNYTINFSNVENENKNTFEFRIFNGTLEPNLLIENIRLVGRLMEKTKKIVEGKDEELINSYKRLQENISEEEKSKILFKMLFPDKKERKPYEKRYKINSQLDKKERKPYEKRYKINSQLNKKRNEERER